MRGIKRSSLLNCARTLHKCPTVQSFYGKGADLVFCPRVDGVMIQTVLESWPALNDLTADTIQASLIEQGQSWVCLDLKKLTVFIAVDG